MPDPSANRLIKQNYALVISKASLLLLLTDGSTPDYTYTKEDDDMLSKTMFMMTVAVVGAFLVLAAPYAFAMDGEMKDAAKFNQNTVGLQLALRDLWVGHIFWVRNVVLATNCKDAEAAKAAEAKVVENARAIADAIAPIYGKEAGDKLFGLLAGHYGAVKDCMNAAFAGNAEAKNAGIQKLTKNAEEIASFLSSANPHWPKQTLVSLLMAHGAHHIAQIDQVHARNFTAEAKTWDDMRSHIYMIADALAGGIVKQFPGKF